MALVAPRDESIPLSSFEQTFFSRPPLLSSLLSQLPTGSIIDLCHTSKFLRHFLHSYPIAWKTLSFRAPAPPQSGLGVPDILHPDGVERQQKGRALDALLVQVVVPFGSQLRSLDLCNTSVSGVALTSKVLEARIRTIEHLSVRNCKNVSIKYHLVPFLQLHNSAHSPWVDPKELALKSLYAYRCRHHRRRPYLPSSLIRRDSDSEPTHELIELCHAMGIWTDTAWCTTPGGRCFRRKDYHAARAAPGSAEVWVPFDRLWRSANRIGVSGDAPLPRDDVRLWEVEDGHNGEALGVGDRDGKDVPAHLRRSYRTFVDDVHCDTCGDEIGERCEQCSIRMHCMGCRKTLCGSCAFNRPLPRKRQKTQDFMVQAFGDPSNFGVTMSLSTVPAVIQTPTASTAPRRLRNGPRFWWAPGANRSPNIMSETATGEDDSETEDTAEAADSNEPANNQPLKLNMFWCCIEPIFSGGGGIAFLGPGLAGPGADKIRAAPLPKIKEFQDPDFTPRLLSPGDVHRLKDQTLFEQVLGMNVDIVPHLQQDSVELQAQSCPRTLCQECYRTFHWKVSCRACRRPLCKEHDFGGLKLRKCGYRDLSVEREHLRSTPATNQLFIPPYRSSGKAPLQQPNSDNSLSVPVALAPSLSGISTSRGAVDMARSTSSSHTADIPAQDISASVVSLAVESNIQSPTPLSPSNTRPRAFSFSDLPIRSTSGGSALLSTSAIANATPKPIQLLSLPCHPRHPVQWQGCGAYFCQLYRPVGDCRQRCTATMKECVECGVNVCQYCIADNPSCNCTPCAAQYNCPKCAQRPAVVESCRRMQEERALQISRRRGLNRLLNPRELASRANAIAESVGQFWAIWDPDAAATLAMVGEEVGSEAEYEEVIEELETIEEILSEDGMAFQNLFAEIDVEIDLNLDAEAPDTFPNAAEEEFLVQAASANELADGHTAILTSTASPLPSFVAHQASQSALASAQTPNSNAGPSDLSVPAPSPTGNPAAGPSASSDSAPSYTAAASSASNIDFATAQQIYEQVQHAMMMEDTEDDEDDEFMDEDDEDLETDSGEEDGEVDDDYDDDALYEPW